MLTRNDIAALDQVRFVAHRDGVMVYKPSEGAMLVPVDALPDLIHAAATRLQNRDADVPLV